MKQQKPDSRQDLILQFLDSCEIDGFVVGQLQRIRGAPDILISIVEGKIQASIYQCKNAVYVLGILRETKAISPLLSVLEAADTVLRLHAIVALGAIGPDEDSRKVLKEIAVSEDSEPAEVAYALQSLERADDPTLISYFEQHPPAHLEDSGVMESLASLQAGRIGRAFSRKRFPPSAR